MGQNFKTAVIGYGFAGKCFHCYLVNITPGLELYGVASSRADARDQIRKDFGCYAYESFESVIEDPDIDLVVIATPHNTHCDLAVRALSAGKHVVTDKVMALTLSECDRMIEAAHQNNRLLSVFQNRRWDGDFLTLRKLTREGHLGHVSWLEMSWQQGFGPPRGWRGRRETGGGKLYDLGAHIIDQLTLFFPGRIEHVFCRMNYDHPDADVESHAMVILGFSNGTTGICNTSSLARIKKPRIYACGDKATFVKYGVDPQESAMLQGDIDQAVEPPEQYGTLHDGAEEKKVETVPGRWRNYYENIADVLAGRSEPLVKLDEVRRQMAVLDAAVQSAHTGEAVKPALD